MPGAREKVQSPSPARPTTSGRRTNRAGDVPGNLPNAQLRPACNPRPRLPPPHGGRHGVPRRPSGPSDRPCADAPFIRRIDSRRRPARARRDLHRRRASRPPCGPPGARAWAAPRAGAAPARAHRRPCIRNPAVGTPLRHAARQLPGPRPAHPHRALPGRSHSRRAAVSRAPRAGCGGHPDRPAAPGRGG